MSTNTKSTTTTTTDTTTTPVSTGWDGIKAGAEAIRLTAKTATPDDILSAVRAVVHSGGKTHTPGDGTPQTGRFTGMRIMQFQDELYVRNMQPTWQFTDAVLIALWKAEFPAAKCPFEQHPSYIKSARGDLNRGKRGLSKEQIKARTGADAVTQFYGKIETPAEPVAVAKTADKKEAKPKAAKKPATAKK